MSLQLSSCEHHSFVDSPDFKKALKFPLTSYIYEIISLHFEVSDGFCGL